MRVRAPKKTLHELKISQYIFATSASAVGADYVTPFHLFLLIKFHSYPSTLPSLASACNVSQ